MARLRLPLVVLAGCVAVLVGVAICPGGQRERPPIALACQTGPTVPGVDVSYHQGAIAWRRVRRAGIRFAFVRVSDGLTVEDSQFAKNWREAKRAGVLRGAYQYFRPDQDVVAQADLLLAAIADDPGELAPVIDVEETGGASPAELAERVRTWIELVRDRLGVEPIVYTGPDFWRARAGSADLASQPLWLAHYTSDCPTVPAPWTRWTFWQHSDTGRVPGITGPVDLDVFSGTLAELQRLRRRRL